MKSETLENIVTGAVAVVLLALVGAFIVGIGMAVADSMDYVEGKTETEAVIAVVCDKEDNRSRRFASTLKTAIAYSEENPTDISVNEDGDVVIKCG